MILLEKMPAIRMHSARSLQQKDRHLDMAKTVLIVEDNTAIRKNLGEVIEEETIHRVFLAADGETALDMMQTVAPKLFLIDYNLPGMNGLEFVDHIRSMKAYERTPVVLMSATIFWEYITDHYLRYIQKPFDLDNILQLVEDTLAAS